MAGASARAVLAVVDFLPRELRVPVELVVLEVVVVLLVAIYKPHLVFAISHGWYRSKVGTALRLKTWLPWLVRRLA